MSLHDDDWVTMAKVRLPPRYREVIQLGKLLALLVLVIGMAFACQALVCIAEWPDQDVLACLKLRR